MAFVRTPDERDGDAAVAQLFQADRDKLGEVANYTQLLALRPRVPTAWQGLLAAIRENMDPRRYELVTLAAARAVRSSYCALAHGSILADQFLDAETVRALAEDHGAAGLDEVDVAVMDFAEKVVRDATAVTQADVDRLRALGLADEDVLDVALAASVRCFWSKTLDALGVEADAKYAALEPVELRDALTVGRPIAPTV
jgi:uncharacterized peroxidase-related enzyme